MKWTFEPGDSVRWNSTLDRGGIVVANEVWIDIDVEALKDKA